MRSASPPGWIYRRALTEISVHKSGFPMTSHLTLSKDSPAYRYWSGRHLRLLVTTAVTAGPDQPRYLNQLKELT